MKDAKDIVPIDLATYQGSAWIKHTVLDFGLYVIMSRISYNDNIPCGAFKANSILVMIRYFIHRKHFTFWPIKPCDVGGIFGCHRCAQFRKQIWIFLVVLKWQYRTNNVWALTPAEKDISILLLKGLGTNEISEIRSTKIGTVKLQVHKVLQKAGASNRAEFMSLFMDEFLDIATELE